VRIPGTVIYDGASNKAAFILNAPFTRGETYTVTLTTNVKDTSGNPLARTFRWSFSTTAVRIYLPYIALP